MDLLHFAVGICLTLTAGMAALVARESWHRFD
jgi:hypothetical protein